MSQHELARDDKLSGCRSNAVATVLLFSLVIATALPAAAQVARWRPVFPTGNTFIALAYDSNRNQSLLFGSSDQLGVGETWERAGGNWVLRTMSGPNTRTGSSMVFDSGHGRAVLFGGSVNLVRSRETWEWDGVGWELVANNGPSARDAHAMAYDSARGRTVLFGGQDNFSVSRQTWEWDGNAWTLRSNTGPTARVAHRMAYDSARGRVVLFGGSSDGVNGNGETWEWDSNTWTLVSSTGPSPRTWPAMAYDSARGRVVLFGGQTGASTLNRETWEWDGATWLLRASNGPAVRTFHALTYDSARGRTVLYGGNNWTTNPTTSYTDTWEWDGAAWTKVAGDAPTPRFGHALAFDNVSDEILLFGGDEDNDPFEAPFSDSWESSDTAWAQTTGGPSGRRYHAMASDSARNRVVMFGGNTASGGSRTDTWEWNGSSWTQVVTPGPTGTYGHAMAYDSARARVVSFGGRPSSGGDQTWEFDGATWTLMPVTGPSSRYFHGLAYDSDRQVTVLFGGIDGDLVDTWEYDGVAWTLVANSGPPAGAAKMAYDAALHRVVLVTETGETWEWNGTVWTFVQDFGPSIRIPGAIAYDAARGRTLLFGFSNGLGVLNETWEYSVSCPADLDGSGIVDLADLTALLGSFGCSGPGACTGDINFDGVTDLADLTALLSAFGSLCAE